MGYLCRNSIGSPSGDDQLVLRCVIGVHPDTPIPDDVHSHALRYRFAVIVDPFSAPPMSVGTVARVVTAVLMETTRELVWNRVVVTMPDGTEYHRLLDATDHVLGDEELNLPAKICYYQDESLFCLENTENWAAIGGPWPYSDSVTFSFYTPRDWALRFLHACERVCAQHPAALERFYPGSRYLVPRSRFVPKTVSRCVEMVRKCLGIRRQSNGTLSRG